MAKPDRLLTFIKLIFPRNPRPARITKIPFIGRWAEKNFFEGDDIILMPKDQVIEVNREIDGNEQVILPSKVIEHFIDKAGFIWLMDFCICRRSNSCKDYPVEIGCIFMGEAAKDINPNWGREITAIEAKDFLKRVRDAGLVSCIGKSKLDTKWLGIGPGDKLLTVCNCCPCCCITRGLPYSAPNLAEKFARMPGVKMVVNKEECTGCGTCIDTCYMMGVDLVDDIAVINEECRACGRCATNCPQNAIELVIEDDQFIKNTISRIDKLVDISTS